MKSQLLHYVGAMGLGMSLAMPGVAQEAAEQAAAAQAPRDEIVLKDGSRVLGEVKGVRDGVVTISTEFAGDLSIPLDKVESLSAKENATLLLQDERVVEVEPLTIEDAALVTSAADGDVIALDQLKVMNPAPWELGDGYNWTGLANFALKLERGNTQNDELDYKLETQWVSTRDRYSIDWRGESDETNGLRTADNWIARLKYDYFLVDPWYTGISGSAEHDEFADIDLRYVIGPHIGRKFYDRPLLSLEAEAGFAYTNEDFIVADDQEYGAATWRLKVGSNYLGGDSRLYFDQRGVWNLDQTGDIIIDSTFGLAFPLLWNIEAAAEVLWEYDSGAVENVDDLDETYSLRIGYTW
ncbi:MAG: DUF481 domain-containing protein [Gammaproteobacteria bacterium]|jgi:hypothetical protein|nr:DUF481 domain-containing protein [Gammaproteobacteria bacterium]